MTKGADLDKRERDTDRGGLVLMMAIFTVEHFHHYKDSFRSDTPLNEKDQRYG